jgi:hypothetical protein
LDFSRTLIDWTSTSTGSTTSMLYIGEGGGLPLLKCVLKHDTHVR